MEKTYARYTNGPKVYGSNGPVSVTRTNKLTEAKAGTVSPLLVGAGLLVVSTLLGAIAYMVVVSL